MPRQNLVFLIAFSLAKCDNYCMNEDITRQQVYDAITRERDYQDMVWGRGHDESHNLPAWILILRDLLSKAETAWLVGGPGESQKYILQLVATGVATIEVCGLYERGCSASMTPQPNPPNVRYGQKNSDEKI